MSSEDIVLAIEPRTDKGKAAAGRLRRSGTVPAVIYSDGNAAETVQLNEHEIEQVFRHHASETMIMALNMAGGGTRKVLLKDVQHHPVTSKLLHLDFQEVNMNKAIVVEISIELVGTPIGVSQGGGILDQAHRTVEVECLPGDLSDSIEVDVSHLDVGDSLHVNEVPWDTSKFKVITPGEIAVAGVLAPKVVEEATEEEGAAAEPEVITEKKEDASGDA